MSDEPILTVERVGHSYGTTRILGDVSFELGVGELLAVLGASGSGKSTLLRAIAGFVCATEGRITLGGQTLSQAGRELIPAERRGVGLVFQDYALFPHMSVAENIAYGLRDRAERPGRVRELLQLVDLEGYEERRPNSLSGGQKQRVAIARALAPRPSILLLDEPFANLDGAIRMEVGHGVRDLLRKAGAAGILVTHDRNEAMGLADRVAVLGGERAHPHAEPASLLQLDEPENLFLRPSSIEVASLTGSVFCVRGRADGKEAVTALGAIELHAPLSGDVDILLRSHQLSWEGGSGEDTARDCQFAGPGYRVLVETAAGSVWVDHSERVESGTSGSVRVIGPGMGVVAGGRLSR